MGRHGRFALVDVLSLAEDADYAPAAPKGYGADLDGKTLALRVYAHDGVVGARRWSEEVAGEDLPRAARFLGRDDRGELAAADVSDELQRGCVQPPDDPVSIDHVGGNSHTLDRVLDLTAERLELGHHLEFPPCATGLQWRRASRRGFGGKLLAGAGGLGLRVLMGVLSVRWTAQVTRLIMHGR